LKTPDPNVIAAQSVTAVSSFSMAINRWGAAMVVMAFLAGALAVGALTLSGSSFKDDDVPCGTPVTAALHGKQVTPVQGGSTSFLEVVTAKNRKFLTGGVTGLPGVPARSPNIFTVCRQPARDRVLVSVAALALAALGLVFLASRSGSANPSRQQTAPMPG
jgi:hypothetical protein